MAANLEDLRKENDVLDIFCNLVSIPSPSLKEDKVIGEQNVKDIEKTIDIMKNLDKDIEVRAYDHAYHGFGTGAGTDADGWMDEAISFWEKEM